VKLTDTHVRRVHRAVPDPGPRADWTWPGETEKAAITARMLAGAPPGPLRVFAYGSLIWKPGIEPARRLTGRLHGWHRAFNIRLTGFRATPDAPGLMMSLAPGGSCTGILLELDPGRTETDFHTLLWREAPALELHGPHHRWVRVATAAGHLPAFCFYAGPRGERVEPGLPHAVVAARLARACGHAGSCAEYLYHTVLHLEAAGIRDRNLWRLQRLVAEEIEALHGV
jgi:cation transport protein ChaC